MTTQDADDPDTESEPADDQQEDIISEEQQSRADGDVEPSESVEEFLSELAEAPDDDVEAVLADILAGDEPDGATDEGGEAEAADVETAIDAEEITVSEELIDELDAMPSGKLAQTLAVMRAEIERLDDRVDNYRERADDLESRLARKQADFQNYKKRQKQRLEDEKQRATEDFVERILDVRDNLARALEQDEDADIRGGIESTLDQFDQQLERENVERIEPEVGGETDPRRHEVLATIASDQPEDAIAQVHRPGYVMGEKVLRPAQVAVSDGSLAGDE